jgi:hypothetical protein
MIATEDIANETGNVGEAVPMFNDDPTWLAVVASYETVIRKIAAKACARDEALREDVCQEARIALATIRPNAIRGYDPAINGPLSVKNVPAVVDRFCRNVARNSILSYLNSYATGSWYSGRKRTNKNKRTGIVTTRHLPARFRSLQDLVDASFDIDERGNVVTGKDDDGFHDDY